jgi:diguanylate cyclase (GGDEF)-like protein
VDPFAVGSCTLDVAASIGIALYELQDATFNDLVNRADEAMYRAKETDKARYTFAA